MDSDTFDIRLSSCCIMVFVRRSEDVISRASCAAVADGLVEFDLELDFDERFFRRLFRLSLFN